MLKNRIILCLMAGMLIMPAFAEPDIQEVQPTATEQPVQEIVKEDSAEVQSKISIPENTIQYKQPVSKRKIAKKFLFAMGGVLASSLLLFILLSIYNKIRDGVISYVDAQENPESLQTPEDLRGAVKTFLDKTNWKN